jgi:hypothetical protein
MLSPAQNDRVLEVIGVRLADISTLLQDPESGAVYPDLVEGFDGASLSLGVCV